MLFVLLCLREAVCGRIKADYFRKGIVISSVNVDIIIDVFNPREVFSEYEGVCNHDAAVFCQYI
jgi:hypothetical protein